MRSPGTTAGIIRFRLPSTTAEEAERHLLRRHPDAQAAIPPPQIAEVIQAAKRYFEGEKIDFSSVPLDLDGQDEFFKQIYLHTRKVGWGETTT